MSDKALEKDLNQVVNENLLLVGRRLKILMYQVLYAIPVVLAVIVIKLLKPFVIVRVGYLTAWRIGCIYPADWHLSERAAGMYGKKYFDIFYFDPDNKIVCNQQWLRMWTRVLCVCPFSKFASLVDKAFRFGLKDMTHNIPRENVLPKNADPADKYNDRVKVIIEHEEPHIYFTEEEEVFGQEEMKKMGIAENKPFICFHSRGSAYLDTLNPESKWTYHDYRDSDIKNYVPAAEEFVRKGYTAVRMGVYVEDKLSADNPNIIDYATNGMRSDFMDIYLSAKCKFFILSDCGVSIMPEMFRKPSVYTNWTVLSRISPWVLHGLFIFKKFYLKNGNRFMTFKEMLQFQAKKIETDNFFEENNIELIESTPEEILDASIEMEQRLDGTWVTSEEDEVLQKRFWDLFGPSKLMSPNVRIGAKFLREHKNLFDQEVSVSGL